MNTTGNLTLQAPTIRFVVVTVPTRTLERDTTPSRFEITRAIREVDGALNRWFYEAK